MLLGLNLLGWALPGGAGSGELGRGERRRREEGERATSRARSGIQMAAKPPPSSARLFQDKPASQILSLGVWWPPLLSPLTSPCSCVLTRGEAQHSFMEIAWPKTIPSTGRGPFTRLTGGDPRRRCRFLGAEVYDADQLLDVGGCKRPACLDEMLRANLESPSRDSPEGNACLSMHRVKRTNRLQGV